VIVTVDISSSSVQLGEVHGLSFKRPTIVIFKSVSKIAQVTVSFVMSVRLSGSMEQFGFHWTEFHEILNFKIFRKSVEKIQVPLKSNKNKGLFT
jgi:hypothetical protein